jgi:carbonic anhydrase/acetyltransferase-like protein (isoleucine patch superfamily)
MSRQAAGLLRQLARSSSGAETQQLAAAVPGAAAVQGLLFPAAATAAAQRPFSSIPAGPSVPPAATSVDISDEWYNRQRQTISLGNRVPDTAVGTYISPSATIVGDVDLLDRVRGLLCSVFEEGGRHDAARQGRTRRCRSGRCAAPRSGAAQVCASVVVAHQERVSRPIHTSSNFSQASIWNHVVLRGDLNNITIGHVSNIQDRTVIHAARWAALLCAGALHRAWLARQLLHCCCRQQLCMSRLAAQNRTPVTHHLTPPSPPHHHLDRRTSPTGLTAAVLIGKFVTVEPNCVLRSCRIQDYCIVGARSVLMEGSMMETRSVLAPGSVLPPARRVPEGELWAGNPARFVRKLTGDEVDGIKAVAEDARRAAWQLAGEELPHGTAWRGVEAQRKAQVEGGLYGWVDLRRIKYDERVKQEEEAAARRL